MSYFQHFFLIILSVYYYFNQYDEKIKSRILQLEKHTIVLNIYRDISQHNFIMVTYKDGQNTTLYYDLKIGDSISKKRNDSMLYIYRKDSILKINLLAYGYKAL